jgi:hypothetical protein
MLCPIITNSGYLSVNYGVSHLRRNIIWPSVIKRAASFSSWVYPFQQALAKTANLSYARFRKNAFDWYKRQQPVSESTGALLVTEDEDGLCHRLAISVLGRRRYDVGSNE